MYDVAEKAGVSTATVSFAFRHPDKVKDDTKAKVLRVAEELGYVPSGNARSLAKGRTGTLGMYAFDMLLERPQGSNLEDDWPDVSPRSIDEPLDGDEPNVLVYPASNSNAGRAGRACSWVPPRKRMIIDL